MLAPSASKHSRFVAKRFRPGPFPIRIKKALVWMPPNRPPGCIGVRQHPLTSIMAPIGHIPFDWRHAFPESPTYGFCEQEGAARGRHINVRH